MQSGFDGAGFTIAVVNDYPPSTADVSAYLTQFGITHAATYSVENVDGGSPQTDASGLSESTLDVETLEALAPGANVIFYATPDLSAQSLIDAYDQILSDGKADAVDMSYGGCEVSVGTAADSLFAQGAAQGIAFVAASGDYGDECFEVSGNQYGVNFPASDPNVIGVGGTQTATISCQMGSIASQQAWNDRCKSGGIQEATGGGVSSMFAMPAYQSSIGVGGNHRNVPDVAMPAVFDGVYLQGSWQLMNGTSWGAPQVAAMFTEIDEYCRSELPNPVDVFYEAFGQKGFADFTAITSGNNQYASDPTYFSADGGFSDVGGIGIPNGMAIAQTVCPNRTPSSLVAMRSSSALEVRAPAQARTVGIVPDMRRLTDLGERSESEATRIAIVLRPTQSVAGDEQTVVADLESAGFAIEHTYPNHLVIDAQAPSGDVERYFGTTLHDFAQGRFGTRYANVAPLVVPSGVAPYVESVVADDVVSSVPQTTSGSHHECDGEPKGNRVAPP